MFYFMMHPTHFIYGIRYNVKDHSDRECTIPQKQDTYTSCGAVAEMRFSSKGPPRGIDPMTHCTTSVHSIIELHLAPLSLKLLTINVKFNSLVRHAYV